MLIRTLTNTIGNKLRKKRLQFFIPLIKEVFERNKSVSIVDLGGTRKYWNSFPKELFELYRIHVTIINLPRMNQLIDEENFTIREGDCCNLKNISDQEFDISHSNSVIEHVGGVEKMRQFSLESRRISTYCYIQTPNARFPIEPHFMFPFFNHLPISLRVFLLLHMNLGAFNRRTTKEGALSCIRSVNLLNEKQFKSFYPDCNIYYEYCLGFKKSLIAIRRMNGVIN